MTDPETQGELGCQVGMRWHKALALPVFNTHTARKPENASTGCPSHFSKATRNKELKDV